MTVMQRTSRILATPMAPPRLALALSASLALAACAGPPARSASANPESSGVVQEGDREQRLRLLQQAEALYLSGRLKEAQAAFEQLTRTYPRNAEIWFRYGNTLMKQGEYDGAAVAFQNAVALDPGHGRAALNLALVRLAQAQAAIGEAHARLPADSQERRQADALQRQLQSLLGAPGGDAPPH